MESPLFQELKKLWDSNSPFVSFRMPSATEATVYFQKNERLHLTEDLNCNGFLMAPFDTKSQIPFIPNEFSERFEWSITSRSAQIQPELNLDSKNKDSFKDLVKKAKRSIAFGKIKKVVLSQTQELPSRRCVVSIFEDLLNRYPLAMVYLWHHPSVGTWFGASPEQFINSKLNFTQTMALAGTQVFDESTTPFWSAKEIEEQELVAIQVEKDLKTLFTTDQIQKSLTTNHRAGNLVHLCTYFQFPKLNNNILKVANALHPTPAVGGVPKRTAQEFIFANEPHDRSFYTGFLGPTNATDTQLFVNLRCARWTKKTTTLYIGAGITQGSDPEKEWVELERKAKTLAKVL